MTRVANFEVANDFLIGCHFSKIQQRRITGNHRPRDGGRRKPVIARVRQCRDTEQKSCGKEEFSSARDEAIQNLAHGIT